MQLTNVSGLPEPIVRAIANDGYSRGTARISVTQLIAPPRQVALMRTHWDDLDEDAGDRIFSLLGQAVHEILRRADMEALTERRLSVTVEGWEVSGAFDRLVFTPQGKMQDYKVTSVWAVRDGAKREWCEQLNTYAHLAREHGYAVDALEVVAILRDWSKLRAQREADYPAQQVVVIPIELWPPERAAAFLADRVRAHQAAETALPACTDEETWRRPDVWAVMKDGRKSAVRLCETEADARALAGDTKGMSVVLRKGEAIRCQSYCAVARFCDQFLSEETTES